VACDCSAGPSQGPRIRITALSYLSQVHEQSAQVKQSNRSFRHNETGLSCACIGGGVEWEATGLQCFHPGLLFIASEGRQLTHSQVGRLLQKAPMHSDAETLEGGTLPQRPLVLLVEDEAPLRQMTAVVLRRLGYRVQEASSGEEALDLAQAGRDKIDLLITDVLMPGMSGRELAEVLQARDAGLKVLFLSGRAVGRQSVAHTGTAFLQKPFTVDAVSKKIKEVLDPR
jgi:CheY-like chemotaxis protein